MEPALCAAAVSRSETGSSGTYSASQVNVFMNTTTATTCSREMHGLSASAQHGVCDRAHAAAAAPGAVVTTAAAPPSGQSAATLTELRAAPAASLAEHDINEQTDGAPAALPARPHASTQVSTAGEETRARHGHAAPRTSSTPAGQVSQGGTSQPSPIRLFSAARLGAPLDTVTAVADALSARLRWDLPREIMPSRLALTDILVPTNTEMNEPAWNAIVRIYARIHKSGCGELPSSASSYAQSRCRVHATRPVRS